MGAIEAGKCDTIAVLGNGVNVYYPQGNKNLQDKIGEHGLLVSEYLPNARSTNFSFPQRNRIVAGLAGALLIVEADTKSGTMITKDFALDLGMDVYAIPGSVLSPQSRGTNALIREAAVACATCPDDVLQSFGVTARDTKLPDTFLQISFDEKRVLDVLQRDEVHIDDIMEQIKMPIPKLATLLTGMEMRGIIKKAPGNKYCRNLA